MDTFLTAATVRCRDTSSRPLLVVTADTVGKLDLGNGTVDDIDKLAAELMARDPEAGLLLAREIFRQLSMAEEAVSTDSQELLSPQKTVSERRRTVWPSSSAPPTITTVDTVPVPTASLESLDGHCLARIGSVSRTREKDLRRGSLDRRIPMLGQLSGVCRALRAVLAPVLEPMRRAHRGRKQRLTQVFQSLACEGSWNHHLKLVRYSAASFSLMASQRMVTCEGGCGREMKMSRMLCLLDGAGFDPRIKSERSKRYCGPCARVAHSTGLSKHVQATFTDMGNPFGSREEVTADEGLCALRLAVCQSGYGLQALKGGVCTHASPLSDQDCTVLCDGLVSGLGYKCLLIDLSYAKLGDAGLQTLSEGLYVCTSLLHLNLNGNPAGDEGVAALAKAFACQRPVLSNGQRLGDCCPNMHWLYLVLDQLGSTGALALAEALGTRTRGSRTPPQPVLGALEVLWCCGAFSSTSEPGAASAGFQALTRACDARGLQLELEHGLPWGM